MRESSQLVYSRQDYVDRHGQDGETIRRLALVARAVETERDYGLGREYRMPTWMELIEGMDSLEILSFIARNDAQIKTLYTHVNVTPLLRALATELLLMVHCRHVLKDLEHLKKDIHREEVDDTNLLEQGSLLLSQCILSWKDLLLPENEAPRYTCRHSRAKLDELGNQLQDRLDSRGGVEALSTLGAVGLLNAMLIEDMGFAGNDENYYDEKNSSIDHVLKSRKGIPLTLAVIYKLILNRVGVIVDIIGLPGHVVLGIPHQETFVDVYNGGRTLSVEDCRNIVLSYEVEWNTRFLAPLTVVDTILRMERNAEGCHVRAWHQSMLTKNLYSYHRLDGFAYLLEPDRYGRQMLQYGMTYVDPEIFRHFDLIDDDTMRRHQRAAFG